MKKLLPLALLLSIGCRQELVCPADEADCGGRCVSLARDPRNCGACGVAVSALQVCRAGVAACAPGVADCGGKCVDTARDPAHCGACNAACSTNPYCATVSGVSGCAAACPAGTTACGFSCVDLTSDRFHCGACGHGCAPGVACLQGACSPMQVACYATNEVVPVAADLGWAGDSRATPAGPTVLAVQGDAVYSANGYPQASVSVLPVDPGLASHSVTVAGNDLEEIQVAGGVVIASNSAIGTLLFLSLAGDVIGEIAMPDQQSFPNPYGFAIVGSTAYVALTGGDSGSGQAIARVALDTAACAADPLRTPCGALAGKIDLLAVPGAYDAPGRPYPGRAATYGGRVFVTLANLKKATLSCGTGCTYTAWSEPAGHGKLAVIDPAKGDAVTIVDLGAGCGNPGSLEVHGDTLWVACGSWTFPSVAPGALVPVDLKVDPPAPGAPLSLAPLLPGGLAFCGGVGYATDQASGAVVRFDPIARTAEKPVTICPTSTYGWAWASDVACGR